MRMIGNTNGMALLLDIVKHILYNEIAKKLTNERR